MIKSIPILVVQQNRLGLSALLWLIFLPLLVNTFCPWLEASALNDWLMQLVQGETHVWDVIQFLSKPAGAHLHDIDFGDHG